jgi:hypothetical protein
LDPRRDTDPLQKRVRPAMKAAMVAPRQKGRRLIVKEKVVIYY